MSRQPRRTWDCPRERCTSSPATVASPVFASGDGGASAGRISIAGWSRMREVARIGRQRLPRLLPHLTRLGSPTFFGIAGSSRKAPRLHRAPDPRVRQPRMAAPGDRRRTSGRILLGRRLRDGRYRPGECIRTTGRDPTRLGIRSPRAALDARGSRPDRGGPWQPAGSRPAGTG